MKLRLKNHTSRLERWILGRLTNHAGLPRHKRDFQDVGVSAPKFRKSLENWDELVIQTVNDFVHP